MNAARQLEKEIVALQLDSAYLVAEELAPGEFAEAAAALFPESASPSTPKKTPSPVVKPASASVPEVSPVPSVATTPPPAVKRNLGDLPIHQAKTLDSLRLRIKDCTRCGLAQARRNVVFGQGREKADVVFVGEGPGENEDLSGLAFVGKAGKLLTPVIQSMGLNRKDVFITNVVKCRPPGNRNPEREEVSRCAPILERQIELLDPKLLVAVGGVAAQRMLESKEPVTRLRRKIHRFMERDLLVIYHPAYLLRNPNALETMWEDAKWIRREVLPRRLALEPSPQAL